MVCLRSFAKEERALKMRSAHQKLTKTNWEPSLKLILLQVHEKLPRNSMSTIPMVIQHLKQIGKVGKLGKWVPHALPTKSKTTVLKYCLLLFYATTNHFSRLWHDEKWILYDSWWWPAQWLDRVEAPKHFPKPNCTKNRSWSLFGGLMLVWSTTAFWIPLHLRSMLSKLMWCTENCSACSWYWSPEWAQFCKTACYTTNAAKVEWIGLWSFASPTIFTWPLANRLPFLQASWQLFAEKMFPQPAGGRKCFPRAHQILKHGFFATGVNKFVSLWQKYVDCNGSYFD